MAKPHEMSSTGVLRILAIVLSSNLFLLASCTGGLAIGVKLNEDWLRETGGRQGADSRMMVVAIAPESKGAGKPVPHQVMFSNLDKFKAQHTGYSFLLPLGSGRVHDSSAEMHARYTVRSARERKVLVETQFNHEMLDVFGRYEATQREIKPLYSKAGSNFLFGLVFGLALASVLRIAGAVLQRYLPLKKA
jgi:hypothetical protein